MLKLSSRLNLTTDSKHSEGYKQSNESDWLNRSWNVINCWCWLKSWIKSIWIIIGHLETAIRVLPSCVFQEPRNRRCVNVWPARERHRLTLTPSVGGRRSSSICFLITEWINCEGDTHLAATCELRLTHFSMSRPVDLMEMSSECAVGANVWSIEGARYAAALNCRASRTDKSGQRPKTHRSSPGGWGKKRQSQVADRGAWTCGTGLRGER